MVPQKMEIQPPIPQAIAIVLLNYNGQNWLQQFLPSLILHSPGQQIYVIDNASTDDSVKYLQQNFPEVIGIQNAQNFGFAKGYNMGLKQIEAPLYCLINTDVAVSQDWLSPVIELFNTDHNIAAIQPKVLDFYQQHKFEYAGAGGGLIDNLGFPYCRGRIFEQLETDHGQYNDIAPIFWASGCCLFIRSEDFWQEHGFDDDFFAHQEEIDLCWRLINRGKKIMYCGHSHIYHVGGGTLAKQNPKKTFLNIRNNLSMMLKNLPKNQILPKIFIRLCLDAGIALLLGYKHGWAPFMLGCRVCSKNVAPNKKAIFTKVDFCSSISSTPNLQETKLI
jgi:GT2 family glycosyltransferase